MIRQRGFVMTLWMYGALLLGILLAAYALLQFVDSRWATSAGVTKGKAAVQADWDKANKEQRDREATAANAASTNLEKGNAKAKIVYRTITEQVDRIVEREVYRHICFDADGLLRVNAALVGGAGSAPGQPDSPVSRPLTTLRWDRSLGAAQAGAGG